MIVYEGVNDPTELTSGHFGNFLGDNRNNYPKPVGQIISQIHPGYSVYLNHGTQIQNSISILNIFNHVLINILSTLDPFILAGKSLTLFGLPG